MMARGESQDSRRLRPGLRARQTDDPAYSSRFGIKLRCAVLQTAAIGDSFSEAETPILGHSTKSCGVRGGRK
jgi:hypothetical protein